MTMEKPAPRLIFSFGPTDDSFFIGCGEVMEWKNLPPELDYTLKTRAQEVLALSLGEHDAFYCRYIAKRTQTEYTATGNLPDMLKLLLNAWWTDEHELPEITFGPHGGFCFQRVAMTAYERIPKRLADVMSELRMRPNNMEMGCSDLGVNLAPRVLAMGKSGGFIIETETETDDGMAQPEVSWDSVDRGLADMLHRLVEDERREIEAAALSLTNNEDYFLLFTDGSIFYSVQESLLPILQRFVDVYHQALREHCGPEAFEEPLYPPPASPAPAGDMTLELPEDFFNWSDNGINNFLERAVPITNLLRGSTGNGNANSTVASPRSAPTPPGGPGNITLGRPPPPRNGMAAAPPKPWEFPSSSPRGGYKSTSSENGLGMSNNGSDAFRAGPGGRIGMVSASNGNNANGWMGSMSTSSKPLQNHPFTGPRGSVSTIGMGIIEL